MAGYTIVRPIKMTFRKIMEIRNYRVGIWIKFRKPRNNAASIINVLIWRNNRGGGDLEKDWLIEVTID